MAKNGVNWEEWGFTVYGECPEYKPSKRFSNKRNKNISFTRPYQIWQRLLVKDRGQDSDKQAVLCEEWKDYNNYLKWHEANYYEVEGEKMLLSYRVFDVNNHYISPDTCMYVPSKISKALALYRPNQSNYYSKMAEEYQGKIPEKLYEKMKTL